MDQRPDDGDDYDWIRDQSQFWEGLAIALPISIAVWALIIYLIYQEMK